MHVIRTNAAFHQLYILVLTERPQDFPDLQQSQRVWDRLLAPTGTVLPCLRIGWRNHFSV